MARRIEKVRELKNTLLIRELEIALLKVQAISHKELTKQNSEDLCRLKKWIMSVNLSSHPLEPFDWEEHEDK